MKMKDLQALSMPDLQKKLKDSRQIFLKERTGEPATAPEPAPSKPRRRKAATEETA